MEIGRMKQKDQDQEEEDGCTGARMTKQEPLVCTLKAVSALQS